jgi:hypothetical protein
MHTAKYLKKSYFYSTKIQKICVSMHFVFNNQFIKVTRTRPIFQKYPKNILFSFRSEIMNLYVKRILDIKKNVVFYWR